MNWPTLGMKNDQIALHERRRYARISGLGLHGFLLLIRLLFLALWFALKRS